jgi:hypothetical protein
MFINKQKPTMREKKTMHTLLLVTLWNYLLLKDGDGKMIQNGFKNQNGSNKA